MKSLKIPSKSDKSASKDKGELKEEIEETKGYEPNHLFLTQFKDTFEKWRENRN